MKNVKYKGKAPGGFQETVIETYRVLEVASCQREGKIDVSNGWIAKLLKKSKPAVIIYLRALENQGCIKRDTGRGYKSKKGRWQRHRTIHLIKPPLSYEELTKDVKYLAIGKPVYQLVETIDDEPIFEDKSIGLSPQAPKTTVSLLTEEVYPDKWDETDQDRIPKFRISHPERVADLPWPRTPEAYALEKQRYWDYEDEFRQRVELLEALRQVSYDDLQAMSEDDQNKHYQQMEALAAEQRARGMFP